MLVLQRRQRGSEVRDHRQLDHGMLHFSTCGRAVLGTLQPFLTALLTALAALQSLICVTMSGVMEASHQTMASRDPAKVLTLHTRHDRMVSQLPVAGEIFKHHPLPHWV